jgi:hypothetical protein
MECANRFISSGGSLTVNFKNKGNADDPAGKSAA